MKIGRREHLRRLGLGAAGIVGAGLFENGLSRIANANPTVARKLKARPWPWISSAPTDENPGIRILFAGMMVFTYKGRQARVVFHNGSDHHNLEIVVFERGTPCIEILRKQEPDIPSKVELIKPSGPDDVQFFATGDPDNFNRPDWHDKDFRWLIDLEGPETYWNQNLKRTRDKGYKKTLHVESGSFYTFQRTNSTFTAEVGSLMCPEFRIARIMACDIPLEGTETFVLKVGDDEVRMRHPSKYEIYFLNNCETCTTSDFPMVFDAIENEERYKFDLKLFAAGAKSPIVGLCYPQGVDRGTDEAPCMGGGLGAGNGFP